MLLSGTLPSEPMLSDLFCSRTLCFRTVPFKTLRFLYNIFVGRLARHPKQNHSLSNVQIVIGY